MRQAVRTSLFSFVFFLALGGAKAVASKLDTSCKGPRGESYRAAKARLTRRIFLDVLRYAREQAHPKTGFVLDTVGNYGETEEKHRHRSSISSTGFMMALVANLSTKGLVSETEALNYCRRPIRAVIEKKRLDARLAEERKKTGAPNPYTDLSYRGWFSHFIDWETGDRWLDSAYAVTDSIWFVAGAIVCAMTFPHSELPTLVDREIYGAVDFAAMMTDEGKKPAKRTLSMSYLAPTPGESEEEAKKKGKHLGYAPFQWDIYQHSWLPYLLGLGSPSLVHRLPREAWSAWRRSGAVIESADPTIDGKFLYGDRRALFSHYFPAVFMPPAAIRERCGIDYFRNSQLASRFNRAASLADTSSKTFRAGFWGLDAGPNPITKLLKPATGDELDIGPLATNGYGVNTPYKRNGTACLACAVAAAMFDPDLAFGSLREWCEDPKYGGKLWGVYGPTNAVNLDYGWIAPYTLSGVVGPMALSVANVDSRTSVWRTFMRSRWVRLALARARTAPLPPEGCRTPEHH